MPWFPSTCPRINAFKNLRHLLLKSKSMHFMFWHGHIDWGGGETGGVGWNGGVVVGGGMLTSPSFFLSLSSNLRASLFCALSRCQCLVTLPSLMAFLCSIYAPPTPTHPTSPLISLLHPLHLPTLPPPPLFSLEPSLRCALFSPTNQYSVLPPVHTPRHSHLARW